MDDKLSLPTMIGQPVAVSMRHGPTAYLVLSPYGGAGRDEIAAFPKATGMVRTNEVARAEGSLWRFWMKADGHVGVAVSDRVVVRDLSVPVTWALLARGLTQIAVAYFPDLRHPTGLDIGQALGSHRGWWAVCPLVEKTENSPQSGTGMSLSREHQAPPGPGRRSGVPHSKQPGRQQQQQHPNDGTGHHPGRHP